MQFSYTQFASAIKGKMNYGDSLRSVSEETGLSVSTIWRVLKGNDARVSTILTLCAWLDQPITDFIQPKPNNLD